MTTDKIIWLGEPEAMHSTTVGAKAANLAAALRRGYAVPDGFCLTGRAVDARMVRVSIERLAPPWAIRSSAIEEDGHNKSYAGIFNSRLGVTNGEEAAATIVASMRQGGTQRYRTYTGTSEMQTTTRDIPVLVQTMVDAVASGVAFSAHPLTGASTITIESNFGLGLTVVDGSVVPDHFEVHRHEVTAAVLGSKRRHVALVNQDAGSSTEQVGLTERRDTPKMDRERFSLSKPQVLAVAELATSLEKDCNYPIDIEWCIDRLSKIWLLQVRPITTIRSDINNQARRVETNTQGD